jgi:predicted RNA binding protein YcfA (HicA-like mRNA interferase family)
MRLVSGSQQSHVPLAQGQWGRRSKRILRHALRDLIQNLEKAGFAKRGGKGSHRKFVHPKVAKPVVISGNLGDDALHYQRKAVKHAIEESKR